MKSGSDIVQFNIADLVFQINFGQTTTTALKADFRNNIIKYYSDFLQATRRYKADGYIDVTQAFNFQVTKKGSAFLIQLYKQKKGNRVNTYYQVGPIYFLFIVKKLLIKLLKNTGFVMHSSASLINNKAFLFLGLPEAGKSTIVKLLSPEYTVLSDEQVILKEQGKTISIYQTPLFEDNPDIKKSKTGHTLGKIFFLRKAKNFKIKKITNKDVILRLLLKQIWIDHEYRSWQLKLALDFISKYEDFYLLYFAKDKQGLIEFFKKNLN